MIRTCIIGDVMGKAGRRCLDRLLPKVRQEFSPDLVIANGENAAGGFGLNDKVFKQMTEQYQIDCITMGNHWQDKKEIHEVLMHTDKVVLPANMGTVTHEERGLRILQTKAGLSYAVVNMLGVAFMKGENRPIFPTVDRLLEKIPVSVKIRFLDFHGEATSEKQALGHYLVGKFSMVYGTHSHVPTADERILGGKTGFATDIGMTGGYDSVIGIKKEAAILRLRTGEKKNFEPAEGDPWLCALIVDIDEVTGHCKDIRRIRWELSSFKDDLGELNS